MTKVLYVEDNDDNVFMLKMRLELLGDFEVLTAEDGEKGCEMAAAERPDIILMDLEMPVVDGWEATRRLKGNPQTRDIPIIALSAHALAGEREKALAAGCNESVCVTGFEPLHFGIRSDGVGHRLRLSLARRRHDNFTRDAHCSTSPASRVSPASSSPTRHI